MPPSTDLHQDPAPVLVEIVRGAMVESRHRGAFAVVDAAGKIVRSAGAVDQPVFPRSAIKPLQALPLLETGAADKYGLGAEELALACASHHGEPVHVQKVSAWLCRIGMGEGDLECGAHLPTDVPSAQALIRGSQPPSQLHNNCSGKHTGFLCTAACLGEDHRGYIEAEHPVMRRVITAVGDMTGTDMARAPAGRDGCGIPVIGLTLQAMAQGMARMADPTGLHDERRAASTRILDAMAAHPLLVDGTGGLAVEVMLVAGDQVRLKPGAEGVFCAALPKLGLGLALKIEDGAGRAAEVAVAALLDRLGCFTDDQRMALHPFLLPKIKNVAGVEVGVMRPAAAFDF
ncbi:asparaginase [Aliidongia dinghuensis]|uniref:asparaginase n=1 Tax=Aliidongia dinghuensis TaxID=1867774 RepID=UPI001E31B5F6|nr:asparaginase [Aliidongia dinghuensis]